MIIHIAVTLDVEPGTITSQPEIKADAVRGH